MRSAHFEQRQINSAKLSSFHVMIGRPFCCGVRGPGRVSEKGKKMVPETPP